MSRSGISLPLLLLVALLLAGGASWWLFGGKGDGEAVLDMPARTAPPAPAHERAAPGPLDPPRPSVPAREDDPAVPPSRPDEAPRTDGPASLTVRLLYEGGDEVTGGRLTLHPYRWQGAEVEATHRSGGAWHATGLAPKSWEIRYRPEGVNVSSAIAKVELKPGEQRVQDVRVEAASFVLRVIDKTTGRELPEAEALLMGERDSAFSGEGVRADALGLIRFDGLLEGEYRVWVRAPGYAFAAGQVRARGRSSSPTLFAMVPADDMHLDLDGGGAMLPERCTVFVEGARLKPVPFEADLARGWSIPMQLRPDTYRIVITATGFKPAQINLTAEDFPVGRRAVSLRK